MTSLSTRPAQLALYAGAAGMAAFVPFAALASRELAACQVVLAAVTATGAFVLGRLRGPVARRAVIAIAMAIPVLYGPIVSQSGGATAPTPHEVNNPLAFMKSNSQSLFDTAKGEDDREALADALHGVERISGVVEQLRVIAGRVPAAAAVAEASAGRPSRVVVELPRI